MDLHDFEGQDLYFDKELPAEVNDLINSASTTYGTPQAEESLMRAFFLEPDNLEVLVALYRYFYYQHKYKDALVIARHALKFSGQGVDFPDSWRELKESHITAGAVKNMGLVRFYLIALKAAGYINLRLHDFTLAKEIFEKVVELDTSDRLRVNELLAFANEHVQSTDNNVVH